MHPSVAVPGFWENLQTNAAQWADEATISPLWKAATEALPEWSADFRKKTGSDLLALPGLPRFVGKGLPRLRVKAYKLSVASAADPLALWNAGSPPVPRLNDLVRARIQCRYLDGVGYFSERFIDLAKAKGVEVTRHPQGRVEGYFAQHLYFKLQVFFRFAGGQQVATVEHEVQVATELATRIWEACHGVYEGAREAVDEPSEWQWNAQDPRFLARQMGHMIHLADGLLVQIRNALQKERAQ